MLSIYQILTIWSAWILTFCYILLRIGDDRAVRKPHLSWPVIRLGIGRVWRSFHL
jgi:hypothetical protein